MKSMLMVKHNLFYLFLKHKINHTSTFSGNHKFRPNKLVKKMALKDVVTALGFNNLLPRTPTSATMPVLKPHISAPFHQVLRRSSRCQRLFAAQLQIFTSISSVRI